MTANEGHTPDTRPPEPEASTGSDRVLAQRYLSSHERRRGGRGLAVAALVVLFMLTSIAFLVQRGLQTAAGDPSPATAQAAPPPDIPVSVSYEERLQTLEDALDASPTDTIALRSMIDLMLEAHQPERALDFADQWLKVSPGHPEALLKQVLAYSSMGRWDEAASVNLQLYDQEPTRLLTRLNMGSLQANMGDREEARRWWEAIIAEAPESNEAAAARRALAQLDSTEPS